MIELIVEEYCQECPEFSPDIDQTIARSWDDSKVVLSTTVFCKYAYRCKQMEKHFSEKNIDIVECVRCRDCKWWDNEDGAERCTHEYGGMWAKPDGYCSYGERAKE